MYRNGSIQANLIYENHMEEEKDNLGMAICVIKGFSTL